MSHTEPWGFPLCSSYPLEKKGGLPVPRLPILGSSVVLIIMFQASLPVVLKQEAQREAGLCIFKDYLLLFFLLQEGYEQ